MRGSPSDRTLTDAGAKRTSEQDERDEEQEDEQTYEFQTSVKHLPTVNLDPKDEISLTSHSRWWFAATGFPLIAGTFGPMASAFSILALVANWREKLGGDDSHTGAGIPDPRW
jgi:potassium channel subfamily K